MKEEGGWGEESPWDVPAFHFNEEDERAALHQEESKDEKLWLCLW